MLKYILVIILLVGFITPALAENCEELLLGDWYYVCENKISTSEDEQPPWELHFSSNAFLSMTQISGPGGIFERSFGCQCKSTGSFNNPNFDASIWLHCATNAGSSIAVGLEGLVVHNGGAIIQGEAVNGNGISWVYECSRVFDD